MMSDPLFLFREAAEALRREDWRAVSDLCDPASLDAFKRQQLEFYDPAEPQPELTLEEFVRYDPDMPRAVAEYEYARLQKHRDPIARLQTDLPGIRTIQELRESSPADVFAAWLRGRSARHQMQLLVEEGHLPEGASSELQRLAEEEIRPVSLGAVQDGERVVHVVFRHELGSSLSEPNPAAEVWRRELSPEERDLARDLSDRDHPQVATCRRQANGEWRLIVGHDFLGLGQFVVSTAFEIEADDEPDVA